MRKVFLVPGGPYVTQSPRALCVYGAWQHNFEAFAILFQEFCFDSDARYRQAFANRNSIKAIEWSFMRV
jgi:hypothetical protein